MPSSTPWMGPSVSWRSCCTAPGCVCWALRLRVKDVDFARNQITVRGGKGDRDRVTMLPVAVGHDLGKHLEMVRDQPEADLRAGAGWVELPWALARKYPGAGCEWGWQWLFPATRTYLHRETGQRRRHHLHESVLQRAVKAAVRRTGLAKRASCHTFRHSFATHLLEDGADIRTVRRPPRTTPVRVTLEPQARVMSQARVTMARSPQPDRPADLYRPHPQRLRVMRN